MVEAVEERLTPEEIKAGAEDLMRRLKAVMGKNPTARRALEGEYFQDPEAASVYVGGTLYEFDGGPGWLRITRTAIESGREQSETLELRVPTEVAPYQGQGAGISFISPTVFAGPKETSPHQPVRNSATAVYTAEQFLQKVEAELAPPVAKVAWGLEQVQL